MRPGTRDPQTTPARAADRGSRRAAIRDVLAAGPVRSQRELALELERRGLATTQATLSRDLRELGVVKTRDGYALGDRPQPSAAADDLAADLDRWLLGARSAGNQLVLRTPPGAAPALALSIDRATAADADVLGTIAGDDTVLVVCADATAARRTERRLAARPPRERTRAS